MGFSRKFVFRTLKFSVLSISLVLLGTVCLVPYSHAAEKAQAAYTLYFAEGYTGQGFEEYLVVANPQGFFINVQITFQFSDGSSQQRPMTVMGLDRSEIDVRAEVGDGREVSIKIESDQQFFAERAMYFNYHGWTGGTSSVGTRSPSKTWYFAEGYTGPGFEEYICVQNTADTAANLTFCFQTEEIGEVVRSGYSVLPHSRATFNANGLLGPRITDIGDTGYQTSLRLESDQLVVAERPVYFDYMGFGNWHWDGGHCVLGATSLSKEYYFGEGTTRGGFEEYITIQNDNPYMIQVQAAYQPGQGQGTPTHKTYNVPGKKRFTLFIPGEVGAGVDVSAKLSSSSEFLAERPMYFDYIAGDVHWTGGHCVVGAPSTALRGFFADGYIGAGYHEYLCLQNPNPQASTVDVTFYYKDTEDENGNPLHLDPQTFSFTIPPNTRDTHFINAEAAPHFTQVWLSLQVSSGPGIIAERPWYFSHTSLYGYETITGGSDVVGNVP